MQCHICSHLHVANHQTQGYLFFTSVGIIYGFKKPLAFFDFASIDSVSYTNVLSRTFNLVITTASSQEIEFGMLDQADFDGIKEYVSNHDLQDASMAAARRAKKLNVNPPAEENGTNGVSADTEEGETELSKAARLLQEQEDEEEDDEDFDPGSDGESEGSGLDSEDDDDEEGAGYEEGESGQVYDGGYDDEDAEMES